ncbi:Ubiquitin-specific protease, partial [Globisporangium splendens]
MMVMAPQSSVALAAPGGAGVATNHLPAQGAVFNAKSAVALVNERRIEFVRARNVRVIGKIDEATGKVLGASSTSTTGQKKRVLVESEDIERLLAWKHSKKIGPGFANLGNTCYLNSVLQCLSYTPSFVQYLLEKDVFASFAGGSSSGNNKMLSNGNKGSNGFCGVRVMSRLLQSIHGNGGSNGRVLQPKEFVMNIRHVSRSFRIGRQEDSHEFFRLLLDSMQRSCLRKANIKRENHPAAPTTLVNRIFAGKLKNSLKCAKCKYVSERFDDFLDLSLEINNGIKSIKGALKHFTAVETLDDSNAWKCSSCKQLNRAEKGMTIETCPNVLVIQLKRFDIMFGKIKKHIEFPTSLDLASGMSKSSDDRKRGRTKYELHAVLVHAGYSTDCGHYYAFVKGPSGQWYEMNDESVRWVSLDTVLQQKAYMLFYSRALPLSERPKPKEKAREEVATKDSAVKPHAGEEIPVKVTEVNGATALKTAPKPTKELDMNGFLASLKTNITSANATDDTTSAAREDVDIQRVPSKKKSVVVTFNVTKRRALSSSPSAPAGTSPIVSLPPKTKRSLTPAFSGRVGRLYKFGAASWRPSSPLDMVTSEVSEVVEETRQSQQTQSKSSHESSPQLVAVAAAPPAADPKPAKLAKIHFDPRQLKNIGVKSAALFGKSVDKWGETNGWEDEASNEQGENTTTELDRELAAKHDRIMSKLKNEDWKHRNAGRQDYWDATLDAGKIKKVKKRKEFVPNQGSSNKFQMKLQHKKQRQHY